MLLSFELFDNETYDDTSQTIQYSRTGTFYAIYAKYERRSIPPRLKKGLNTGEGTIIPLRQR